MVGEDTPGIEMKAVFVTAGAAGMYCGSCMHDNALAKALRRIDVDCLLQPVYTPIRTDSQSIATKQVFFGGIHVYLLQQWPWLARMPRPLWRFLDWPPLIRFATSRASSTDAALLGDLAVSMLRGTDGRQAEEVVRLVDWFQREIRPDAIVLSNLLIGGALPELRRALPTTKIIVLLQGDDIFLNHLPAEARREAIELCCGLIEHIDHVVVNSVFYQQKMGTLFRIPAGKMVVTPLSIDPTPFLSPMVEPKPKGEFRLGFLARIAPEKGLHRLVEAFIRLAKQPGNHDLTLHAAGWLGDMHRDYLQTLQNQINRAGLSPRFTYHGSPDLATKASWLRSLDLCSVPTEYEDPKGLYVLESLAAGVPVIQPNHGAFGELLASTGGGCLFAPQSIDELCQAIQQLKDDPQLRAQLAAAGHANVLAKHSIEAAAKHMHSLMTTLLPVTPQLPASLIQGNAHRDQP